MSLVDRRGNPLATCAEPNCRAQAVVFPEITVPPKGHPIERGLRFEIGLGLCAAHGREEVLATFVTDRFRKVATDTAKPSPVPLDFERAVLKMQPIGGPAWDRATKAAAAAHAGRVGRPN